MELDLTTFKANADGSFSVSVDGKSTRLVKESDLLAVKGASETARRDYEDKIASHQAALTQANLSRDTSHQELLQSQAASEQLKKDAQEVAALRTKAGELETKVATLDRGRSELEQELTGIKRSSLVTGYKLHEDKVKGLTLSQLRDMEKNFQLVGFNPSTPIPARYDGGGGGGGAVPTTPLEQAKVEIKLARELQAKKARGE